MNFWINLGHQLIKKIDDTGVTEYINGSSKPLSLNPKISHQAALTGSLPCGLQHFGKFVTKSV